MYTRGFYNNTNGTGAKKNKMECGKNLRELNASSNRRRKVFVGILKVV